MPYVCDIQLESYWSVQWGLAGIFLQVLSYDASSMAVIPGRFCRCSWCQMLPLLCNTEGWGYRGSATRGDNSDFSFAMALNSLHCAEVPLRNCSLTHSLIAMADFGFGAGLDAIRTRVRGSRLPYGSLSHYYDRLTRPGGRVRHDDSRRLMRGWARHRVWCEWHWRHYAEWNASLYVEVVLV